jgi:hypothetical protein
MKEAMSARCAQLSSPTLGRSPQCFRQAAALDRVVGGSGYLAEVDAPGLHRPHVVRLTCSLLNEFPTTGMRLDLLWEAPAEGLIQLRGAGLALQLRSGQGPRLVPNFLGRMTGLVPWLAGRTPAKSVVESLPSHLKPVPQL